MSPSERRATFTGQHIRVTIPAAGDPVLRGSFERLSDPLVSAFVLKGHF